MSLLFPRFGRSSRYRQGQQSYATEASAFFFLFLIFPAPRYALGQLYKKRKKRSQFEADRYIHPNIATENLAGEGSGKGEREY